VACSFEVRKQDCARRIQTLDAIAAQDVSAHIARDDATNNRDAGRANTRRVVISIEMNRARPERSYCFAAAAAVCRYRCRTLRREDVARR